MGTVTAGPVLLDAYYTPRELAGFLVGLLPITPGDLVLEPSAGGGAFVAAAMQRTEEVVALDLNPAAPALAMVRSAVVDFLAVRPRTRPQWVIGNPPYHSALEHVEHALSVTDHHVAFLLRLAFLESKKRATFWAENPCRKVWVLSERPSFSEGGRTDSTAYGFFWWDEDHEGPTELEVVGWK